MRLQEQTILHRLSMAVLVPLGAATVAGGTYLYRRVYGADGPDAQDNGEKTETNLGAEKGTKPPAEEKTTAKPLADVKKTTKPPTVEKTNGTMKPPVDEKTAGTVLSRLRSVSEARSPKEHVELKADHEGRKAEDDVTGSLQSSRAALGELRVWHSLRVPTTTCGGSGRREIDVVLLNERGLHLLEVKHWSGSVRVSSSSEWLQTRRDGSVVRHGNVLATLQVSSSKLRATLMLFWGARGGRQTGRPTDRQTYRQTNAELKCGVPMITREGAEWRSVTIGAPCHTAGQGGGSS